MSKTKTCRSCGKEKPLSKFYKKGYDAEGHTRYRNPCKDCLKGNTHDPEYQRQYRKALQILRERHYVEFREILEEVRQ